MLLYRAINDNDLKCLRNGESIKCSLINSKLDINSKNKKDQELINSWFNDYFNRVREYALNGMIGHVSGAKFKCNRSPWISTSTNFRYVASEYAVPQAGNYNWDDKRKPVILIDYCDNKIYDDTHKIESLKKTKIDDFAINLSDNKLKELYDLDIIENEIKLGYYLTKDRKLVKTSIDYTNNFSTAASEVLIYKEIKNDDIKLIIYPLLQDVIYSCDVKLNKEYKFIIENIERINQILNRMIKEEKGFSILYPDICSANSLTDILKENYSDINGDDIETKYILLKKFKKEELEKLVSSINSELGTNWIVKDLVDDRVIACSYSNIKKYTKRQYNDIVLLENNNKVYKYSHTDCAYVSQGEDKIKIKTKIKKKA